MKVALVYDRVNKWGGAERVLLALNELFPDAPLFTSVYDPQGAPWARKFSSVKTSFLQTIPFARNNHEAFAPLMPLAFESLNFSEYDLVISVSSEAAKGIVTGSNTLHIAYCLTPTRYLWSGYEDHFPNPLFRSITAPLVSHLRSWDYVAAHRSDHMLGISTEVQDRIRNYYNRDVDIVFPPVESTLFRSDKKSKNFYLLVSRLVRYKKVDLAIKAFNRLGLPLTIVGSGREDKRLRRLAKDNIRFVGQLTDSQLSRYYGSAKALVFPQLEDFGIVAVEAQAAALPVVAYRAGGALDTVVEGETGIFFDTQTVEDLVKAIERIDKMTFKRETIVKNAERFSKENFHSAFQKAIKTKL